MLDMSAYMRPRDIITFAAFAGLCLGEIVRIRGGEIDRVGMTISSVSKGDLHWGGAVLLGLAPLLDKYPRN
ncbi:MAG: hypothetical protein ACOH19_12160 [Rhodoglobus sp.]